MKEDEARRRLGVGQNASREEIQQAYDRLASCVSTGSPVGQEIVVRLAEARRVLLAARSTSRLIDSILSPRGTAVQGLAGLVLTGVALLSNANVARISALAPILFGCGAWLSLRQRKRIFGAVLICAVVISATLVVRAFSAPVAEKFPFSGDPVNPAPPPFDDEFIPLTDDPAHGLVATTVESSSTFVVTCTRRGVYNRGTTSVQWAYISGGDYQTLWVPTYYLADIAVGKALSLLPCSDWRWLLHNFGEP